MKKFAAAILCVLSLFLGANAYAEQPIKLMIKGQLIQNEQLPIIKSGRVLVPLRIAAESLGATVDWNAKTNTVTVRKWSETAALTVGKNKARIAGGTAQEPSEVLLDVSATIVNDRVYVPLRFLSQLYGYKVDWSNNTVSIQSQLSMTEQNKLYKGDLETARKLVIKLLYQNLHYEHPALPVYYESEYMSKTFLFPEGEALRMFLIEGDTVSWIEFKEDVPVVTWQAHIKGTDPLKELFQHQWKDETGSKAEVGKPFYYYSSGFMGIGNSEETGKVDLDGTFTKTAYKHFVDNDVDLEEGTITYSLKGEVRKEVIGPVQAQPSQ